MQKIPIYVDLDGTLIRGDCFLEAAAAFVRRSPFNIFVFIAWLVRGRAFAKMMLARKAPNNPDNSVLNEKVVALLRKKKKDGHALFLATAAHRKIAQAIARRVGLFDGVLASNGKKNLKGRNKLKEIQTDAAGPFGYLGDSNADIVIFEAADLKGFVNVSTKVEKRFVGQNIIIVEKREAAKWPLLRAVRPLQWLKNVLIAVPLIVSHSYMELDAVLLTTLAITLFSLVASGVYILNDILDAENDRLHAQKKERPFASGDMRIAQAIFAAMALPIIGIGAASQLMPSAFAGVLGIYLVVTCLYSFWLKQKALVDVFLLASLYTLRVVAGAAAITVPISMWLVGFSFFLFLSLAYLKRLDELRAFRRGKQLLGRGYSKSDAPVVSAFGMGSAIAAVVVLAFFVSAQSEAGVYNNPLILWLLCPISFYWLNRIWFKAARGQVGYDPVVFAVKDKVSFICAALMVVVALAAKHLPTIW